MRYVGKYNRNFIKWLKEALDSLGLSNSYDWIIELIKSKDKGIIKLNPNTKNDSNIITASSIANSRGLCIFWMNVNGIKKIYGDTDYVFKTIIETEFDRNREIEILWYVDKEEYHRIVFSELIEQGIEFPKYAYKLVKISKKMRIAIVVDPDSYYLCTPIGYIKLNNLRLPTYYMSNFNKILREIGVDFDIDSSTTWDKIEPHIIKYLLKSVWR